MACIKRQGHEKKRELFKVAGLREMNGKDLNPGEVY